MTSSRGFFLELRRGNVLRVAVLYAAKRAVREALSLQPDGPDGCEGLTVIDILRGAPAAAGDAARESNPQSRALALTEAALAGGDHAKAAAALLPAPLTLSASVGAP